MTRIDGDQSDEHIGSDHQCGEAGEKSEKDEDAAEKFRQSGDVAKPIGKPERSDGVRVVLHRGEDAVAGRWDDLVVAVIDHCAAQNQTQEERAPGLKAIE